MTENDAKLLEKLEELAIDTEVDMYSVASLNFYFEESANTIRNLIEEIQQYRAIGTVEHIKLTFELCKGLDAMVKMYQAIGTVEDMAFYKKCYDEESYEYCGEYGTDNCGRKNRMEHLEKKMAEFEAIGTIDEFKALKEKNTAKKAIVYGHNDAVGTDVGLCPVCNDRPLRACDNQYCPDCGQKLDWSE